MPRKSRNNSRNTSSKLESILSTTSEPSKLDSNDEWWKDLSNYQSQRKSILRNKKNSDVLLSENSNITDLGNDWRNYLSYDQSIQFKNKSVTSSDSDVAEMSVETPTKKPPTKLFQVRRSPRHRFSKAFNRTTENQSKSRIETSLEKDHSLVTVNSSDDLSVANTNKMLFERKKKNKRKFSDAFVDSIETNSTIEEIEKKGLFKRRSTRNSNPVSYENNCSLQPIIVDPQTVLFQKNEPNKRHFSDAFETSDDPDNAAAFSTGFKIFSDRLTRSFQSANKTDSPKNGSSRKSSILSDSNTSIGAKRRSSKKSKQREIEDKQESSVLDKDLDASTTKTPTKINKRSTLRKSKQMEIEEIQKSSISDKDLDSLKSKTPIKNDKTVSLRKSKQNKNEEIQESSISDKDLDSLKSKTPIKNDKTLSLRKSKQSKNEEIQESSISDKDFDSLKSKTPTKNDITLTLRKSKQLEIEEIQESSFSDKDLDSLKSKTPTKNNKTLTLRKSKQLEIEEIQESSFLDKDLDPATTKTPTKINRTSSLRKSKRPEIKDKQESSFSDKNLRSSSTKDNKTTFLKKSKQIENEDIQESSFSDKVLSSSNTKTPTNMNKTSSLRKSKGPEIEDKQESSFSDKHLSSSTTKNNKTSSLRKSKRLEIEEIQESSISDKDLDPKTTKTPTKINKTSSLRKSKGPEIEDKQQESSNPDYQESSTGAKSESAQKSNKQVSSILDKDHDSSSSKLDKNVETPETTLNKSVTGSLRKTKRLEIDNKEKESSISDKDHDSSSSKLDKNIDKTTNIGSLRKSKRFESNNEQVSSILDKDHVSSSSSKLDKNVEIPETTVNKRITGSLRKSKRLEIDNKQQESSILDKDRNSSSSNVETPQKNPDKTATGATKIGSSSILDAASSELKITVETPKKNVDKTAKIGSLRKSKRIEIEENRESSILGNQNLEETTPKTTTGDDRGSARKSKRLENEEIPESSISGINNLVETISKTTTEDDTGSLRKSKRIENEENRESSFLVNKNLEETTSKNTSEADSGSLRKSKRLEIEEIRESSILGNQNLEETSSKTATEANSGSLRKSKRLENEENRESSFLGTDNIENTLTKTTTGDLNGSIHKSKRLESENKDGSSIVATETNKSLRKSNRNQLIPKQLFTQNKNPKILEQENDTTPKKSKRNSSKIDDDNIETPPRRSTTLDASHSKRRTPKRKLFATGAAIVRNYSDAFQDETTKRSTENVTDFEKISLEVQSIVDDALAEQHATKSILKSPIKSLNHEKKSVAFSDTFVLIDADKTGTDSLVLSTIESINQSSPEVRQLFKKKTTTLFDPKSSVVGVAAKKTDPGILNRTESIQKPTKQLFKTKNPDLNTTKSIFSESQWSEKSPFSSTKLIHNNKKPEKNETIIPDNNKIISVDSTTTIIPENSAEIINLATPETSARRPNWDSLTKSKINLKKEKRDLLKKVLNKNLIKSKKLTGFYNTITKQQYDEAIRTKLIDEKKKNATKRPVATCMFVNGKKYVPNKLYRGKRWCTEQLYKYLQNKMKNSIAENDLIHKSEVLMKFMVESVEIVKKSKKDWSREVTILKRELARYQIIETNYDFFRFVAEFLPHEYRLKAVPCTQAYKAEPTILFDERTLHKKIDY